MSRLRRLTPSIIGGVPLVQKVASIGPMSAVAPLKYSKSPEQVVCSDGNTYVSKGVNPIDAIAELTGYLLARQVDLPVPEFALISQNPTTIERRFGSRLVDLRIGADVLKRTGKPINPEFFSDCAVFDVWTCNDDRNFNNVVGRSTGGRDDAEFEWVAIDFESAKLLRGESVLTLSTKHCREFLPRESLKPVAALRHVSAAMAARIHAVTENELRSITEKIQLAFPDHYDFAGRVIHGLVTRAQRIQSLAQEAIDG